DFRHRYDHDAGLGDVIARSVGLMVMADALARADDVVPIDDGATNLRTLRNDAVIHDDGILHDGVVGNTDFAPDNRITDDAAAVTSARSDVAVFHARVDQTRRRSLIIA